MPAFYDTIGVNYSDLRKPDARIGKMIRCALGSAKSVLNVGAGAGSYEPADRQITALEPSLKMIRQRPASGALVVQGAAEQLPFDDKTFDASMAVLTVHHWTDRETGFKEMRRVTHGPVVVLTFDPSYRGCWLTDYFPELITLDMQIMPPMDAYADWLGPVEITAVPVPHDCTDGFLYAYWRRPSAYLESRITAAMSSFWTLGDLSEGLNRLREDLKSGAWVERHADLLTRNTFDAGYRLVRTIQQTSQGGGGGGTESARGDPRA